MIRRTWNNNLHIIFFDKWKSQETFKKIVYIALFPTFTFFESVGFELIWCVSSYVSWECNGKRWWFCDTRYTVGWRHSKRKGVDEDHSHHHHSTYMCCQVRIQVHSILSKKKFSESVLRRGSITRHRPDMMLWTGNWPINIFIFLDSFSWVPPESLF